jgi:hypothetical protein
MKVGVFGWYRYGNFGDDVMAIMIARHLRSRGHEPVVYQLPDRFAQSEEFESSPDVAAFVDSIEACVLGGGGHFCNFKNPQAFDDEISELAERARSRAVPIFGVSLGGDGIGADVTLPPGRLALLSSPMLKGMTLRLSADRPLADAFNIPAQVFDDIVFLSPDYWPATPVPEKERSLILMQGVGSKKVIGALVQTYSVCSRRRRAQIVQTIHAGGPGKESTKFKSFIDDVVPYQDIENYAALVSQASFVISTKLHLGIFAMSYGCTFLSYRGLPKVRAQLAEMGMSGQYLDGPDLANALTTLSSTKSLSQSTAEFAAKAKKSAYGHLQALDEFLQANAK